MRRRTILIVTLLLMFSLLPIVKGATIVNNPKYVFRLDNATDSKGVLTMNDVNTPVYTEAKNGKGLHVTSDGLISSADPHGTGDFTLVLWYKTNQSVSAYGAIAGMGGGFTISLNTNSSILFVAGDSSSEKGCSSPYTSGNIDKINTWNFYVMRYSDGNNSFQGFINNNFQCSRTLAGNLYDTSTQRLGIANRGTSAAPTNYLLEYGHIDELYFYDRYLNYTELTYLYNNGEGIFYPSFAPPPAPPAPSADNILEQTTSIKQGAGTITINSANYTTIFTGKINITSPATQIYYTAAYNLLPLGTSAMTCRATIDGTDYNTENTRTGSSGAIGSAYMVSSNTSLSYGIHNFTFQCKVTSGAAFQVSKTDAIIHYLKNQNNITLQFDTYNATISYASPAAYKNIANLSFTTSNYNSYQKSRAIVFDGFAQINYNATGTNKFYLKQGSESSGIYSRYGSAGSSGNGGIVLALENKTNMTTYNIEVWALGQGSITFNAFIKEFILSHTDISRVNITPVTIDGTLANIANTTLQNTDSGARNIIIKSTFSANSGAANKQLNTQIYLDTTAGNIISRYFSGVSQAGMISTIDDFTNIAAGLHYVNVTGTCTGNSCNILGGDLVTYISENIDITLNRYFITAKNKLNSATISNFSVIRADGTILTTTSGSIEIPLGASTETLIIYAERYLNETIIGHNTNNNLTAYLRPVGINSVTFNNYLDKASRYYARNLSYTLNYSCISGSATATLILNGSKTSRIDNLPCTNNYASITNYYQASTEGAKGIAYFFNNTLNQTQTTASYSFIYDLFPPVAQATLSITSGFTNPNATISINCTDTAMRCPNCLLYNLTFNGATFVYGNKTYNTKLTNTTQAKEGNNLATSYCYDGFSDDTDTASITAEIKQLILIDEKDNTFFDLDNITGARVYFDDNRSFFDFKSNNISNTNFTATDYYKLRFEMLYNDGGIVTRYVDVRLIEDTQLRICANKEGVTHYEQLIISVSETPVILKNVFSNCLIASDYTRFAYQDSKVLKAFTIASMYYLYTFNDAGQQTLLASIDGSIQTFINLDTLEFQAKGYEIDILTDGLSFEKTGAKQVKIYYKNPQADNTALNLVITELANNSIVFETNTFTDPNEFTLYFDYSTLAYVNDTSLFKMELTKTNAAGQKKITKYFNTLAQAGNISAQFALVFSILLVVSGLSLSAQQNAFSFFGIIIILAAIALLSFAATAWYITFMMFIYFIILVYSFIILVGKNQTTIS